jgi:hypothetical protein
MPPSVFGLGHTLRMADRWQILRGKSFRIVTLCAATFGVAGSRAQHVLVVVEDRDVDLGSLPSGFDG